MFFYILGGVITIALILMNNRIGGNVATLQVALVAALFSWISVAIVGFTVVYCLAGKASGRLGKVLDVFDKKFEVLNTWFVGNSNGSER